MQEHETNYPGVGVTAAVEAFNAYILHDEKLARLTPKEYSEYDKLVRINQLERRLEHERSK